MELLLTNIIFFWFIRTIQFVLFWIYLWQLKEYHIGRFTDHFSTHKGKKLFKNPLLFVKIVLLPLVLVVDGAVYALLIIYIGETLLFFKHVAKRSFKKPVLTFKTALLLVLSFGVILTFLFVSFIYAPNIWQLLFALLFFDILLPVVISAIVLLVQPFFVVARNWKLKKAKNKISQFKNLKVIAITGSYGKTATKEFLTTILSQKYNVLSTPKHRNSEMGIAQTILEDLKPEHEIFVVEMGAYNKGGIRLLCDMVKPSIGMVTGVNQQHLATFGSLENLLSAEGGRELVAGLPQSGMIVVNGDNTYCLDLYKKIYKYKGPELKKKAYTLKKETIDSDIWTEDIVVKPTNVSFIVRNKEKEMVPFSVNVLGKQQVQNILGAILVAKELGMNIEEIREACSNIYPEQAGMTLKTGIHGINIIDSSYSSNPDGVIADLDYLHVFLGKKVVVMPCLIELGDASANIHYHIGQKIAKTCDLAIITSQDQFAKIKEGAISSGMKENQIILCPPDGRQATNQIVHMITTLCQEGDAVLLEGRVPADLIRLLNGK